VLDSTRRNSAHPLTATSLALLLAGLVAVLGVGLWSASPARADGDPASDVLATQPLFLAQDAGFTPTAQAQLAAELAATERAHHPLRVAIVASRTDLGSVTALWRQPSAYARFLDQELSSVYAGPLLVVMPNGVGAAGAGADRLLGLGAGSRGQAGPAGSGTSTSAGPELQRVALGAVARFLRATGQPVTVGPVHVGSPGGGTDLAAIVALGVGAVLIACCWGLSLRVRPPGSRLNSSVNP
jgi:hypothetical protein